MPVRTNATGPLAAPERHSCDGALDASAGDIAQHAAYGRAESSSEHGWLLSAAAGIKNSSSDERDTERPVLADAERRHAAGLDVPVDGERRDAQLGRDLIDLQECLRLVVTHRRSHTKRYESSYHAVCSLSRRNVLEHARKGSRHRCGRCRHPGAAPSPAQVERMKSWWVTTYGLEQLQAWPPL